MRKVICDTNVFIRHFKKDETTVAEMVKIGSENVLLPSIVAMELFRGMSNKNEMASMKSKLKHYNLLHVDTAISQKALEFIEAYRLSQDLKLPDAIIGAMAVVYQIPLFTYNVKDFRYLEGIKLYGES
jgi:predicted nucleic acid-binding protein